MKVKLLNQRHPCFSKERLERLSALYEGGEEWHDEASDWLPKRPMEPDDVYAERISLATYTNHMGPIISVLAASLFSEAPQISGLEGDFYRALQVSCDRRGTPWRRWWRDRLVDAQVGGKVFVWVNLPARAADVLVNSRLDEERSGLLEAYLVFLTARQVIDWGEDAHGNLTWLMARDVVSERASIDTTRTKVHRWTYIDAVQIRRWSWTPKEGQEHPADDDDATEDQPIAHNFRCLPVVRLELPAGLWTGGKLEDPAVAALRARNELTWALHQAAHELLTIKSKWGDEKVSLGHGHFLRLQRDADGEDDAAYIAPSGKAFEHLQKDVVDTREEVYRAVQQMALSAGNDTSQAQLSGASKAEDWRAMDIVLASYQDLILSAMRQTLLLVARARGDTSSEVSVTGLNGWATEDLGTFLLAAAQAVDAREASPTFRRLLARREAQRLLQDEVTPGELQEVLDEIEDWEPNPALFTPPPLGKPSA